MTDESRARYRENIANRQEELRAVAQKLAAACAIEALGKTMAKQAADELTELLNDPAPGTP
jgi:uncharacterized membrane protein affecting hemolysin expression